MTFQVGQAALFLVGVFLLPWSTRADSVLKVVGEPKVVHLKSGVAHVVNPDTGLDLQIKGPSSVMLELRSRAASAPVTIMITRDHRYVSKNVIRLRRIGGGGRERYDFVTLLSFRVPEGEHTYHLQASLPDIAVMPGVTKRFIKDFAAAPERDSEEPAHTMQSASISADQQSSVPQHSEPSETAAADKPPPQVQPDPGAQSLMDDAAWGGGGFDESLDVEEATKRLDQAEDVLTIGGMLFIRAAASATGEVGSPDSQLRSPNLTDIYLDGTPNDRVRAYVRARLAYDPTSDGETGQADLSMSQLWLKAQLGQSLFVTFGQQMIKWGTGRFHNPTDFLNRQRRDPFTLVDERSGVPMAKLHVPLQSLGTNLYAIGAYNGAAGEREVEGAVRTEIAFGTAEVSFTAFTREHEQPRFGADLSASLPLIDVFAEAAFSQGGNQRFWGGDFRPEEGVFPELVDRRREWLPQALAGIEAVIDYSDSDRVVVGAEYFFNGTGYTESDIYPWLILQGDYHPFYTGQNYVSGYVQVPSPGNLQDTTILLNTVANLDDGSRLSWIEMRVVTMTVLTLTASAAMHWGNRGEFRLGIDAPATSRSDALERAVPVADFSVGLLTNF
jgi:hypothetical protein